VHENFEARKQSLRKSLRFLQSYGESKLRENQRHK
jgi:hypothetical protein